MPCRIRYLNSVGIHTREIPGIDTLANAFPADWLLYTSLQCFPRNEPPIEIDAMVVMDDRVLLLEIKDWNGTLTHNGDQWLLNGQHRGRSAVDAVSMKARKVKSFLKNSIPGFTKVYVDSRVVLTGSASKKGLSKPEQQHVWSLSDVVRIATPSGKKELLAPTTVLLLKAFQFEPQLESIIRNARMFGPLEAVWDGYRVVEEDVVVHPRHIWREHRAERVRDTRYKALLRVWAFDKLPPGLNSPDKRRFVADREVRAIGRLTALGSRLVQDGGILLPVGSDKDEILTQHFELRTLAPGWTTLDRFVTRSEDDLGPSDRTVAASALLNLVGELHAQGIAHRDLGPRSIWVGSPTRIALTGFMSCQMPDEESVGDWASTLRGYADPAPEDRDPNLVGSGKQRDVFALGKLVYAVLTGEVSPLNAGLRAEEKHPSLTGVDAWLGRATAMQAANRFPNAREMADTFAQLVEQSEKADINDTLIDRHQTTENPYVLFPIARTLQQSPRNHVFVTQTASGAELVVKVWLGLQRGVSTAVDLALTRLFEGIDQLSSSPIAIAPRYIRAALSPLGPFLAYEHESGSTLESLLVEGLQTRFVPEDILRLAIRITEGTVALHLMGYWHGDVAAKNILVRDSGSEPVLLDMFDMTNVGNGQITTPSICPDGWEGLTQQQLDRYATLRIVEQLLSASDNARLHAALEAVRQELTRPAIETLEPTIRHLREAEQQFQVAATPQISLRFPNASPESFRSDNGIYYLRVTQRVQAEVEFSIIGIDHAFVFQVAGAQFTAVRQERTTFRNLGHASQHGIPLRLDISISDGPQAGFEDLFSVIHPILDPVAHEQRQLDATDVHRLDIRRHWRRLLEHEQALQPEVEILKDVSPAGGAFTAYVYERVGLDFDFDAGSTVEVRLPNGKRIGEVNLEQTDSRTLVVDHSERRLDVGDRVNLVDRRARASLDRRVKAVERILDDKAAITGLTEYFSLGQSASAVDFGAEVSEEILDRYRLNSGQRAAFRHVVQYGPVGLLQGPPGTGKTHFIASLVHWLVSDMGAQKILIASQSHEAVNNAIEALLDLFKQLGGRRPRLLRIGSKGITDKIRPYHTLALQERYQSRFETAFKHRVAGLGTAVGLPRQLMNDAVEIDRKFGSLVRRLQMLAAAEQDDGPVSSEERRRRDTALATTVTAFKAQGMTLLEREPDPTNPAAELADAFASLLQEHAGASPADIRKARHLIELSRDWVASLASPHRNFEEFLAKTRSIVTATCVGVGSTRIRIDAKTYDWVIVDEAARCTSSELAVPIQVGRRVLLVGDHRQLLPMMDRGVLKALRKEMPNIPTTELIRSDFERAYHSSYGTMNGRTLTEQYRMTPAICGLISRIFYEPHNVQLTTSLDRDNDSAFSGLKTAPFSHPITWVDTSSEFNHEERPADWDDTTLWNRAEVEAVMRLLERISDENELVTRLAADRSGGPIGVICMYSAQKVKIEQAFSNRPWEAKFRKMVRIETVDSYQGKENTVVIVSLVRCNNRRDQGHVHEPNRCNVALSRAKERLFIVGARTMWDNAPARAPMRRVLEDIDCHPQEAAIIAAGTLQ